MAELLNERERPGGRRALRLSRVTLAGEPRLVLIEYERHRSGAWMPTRNRVDLEPEEAREVAGWLEAAAGRRRAA